MIQKMKIKLECAVCDIPIKERVGDKLEKTRQYNEAQVELSDGSYMTVGVCFKHKKPTKAQLEKITTKTHLGWMEEVELGIGNLDWVNNRGFKLKVVGLV